MAETLTIREIRTCDDPAIAQVIRAVSAEYGLTPDKGYGVSDPTLDCMSQTYQAPNAKYWVIEATQAGNKTILGGAGVAPLTGHSDVCELQKMYFSQQLRGKKMALPLLATCIEFAKQQGYRDMYLETTAVLVEALAFYTQVGFTQCQHLGDTGHDACEIAMIKPL